jgi:hypothetical protein
LEVRTRFKILEIVKDSYMLKRHESSTEQQI